MNNLKLFVMQIIVSTFTIDIFYNYHYHYHLINLNTIFSYRNQNVAAQPKRCKDMVKLFSLFCIYLCHLAPLFLCIDYISITEKLHDVSTKYQLASFTNIVPKSRYVDLVFIGPDHDSVTIMSYNSNDTYNLANGYQYSFKHDSWIDEGLKIVAILPADFNSDKTTDLMVVFAKAEGSAYRLAILWNHDHSFTSVTHIKEDFTDVPHLLDFDGDLHVDFICAQDDQRYFWINDKALNGTFTKQLVSLNDTIDDTEIDNLKGESLYVYGDLNGDCAADLFMISKLKNGSSVFQLYEAKGDKLVKSNIDIPSFPDDILYGAPLIEDMDGNGKLDIVIPSCSKVADSLDACIKSRIVVYYNDPCNSKSSDKCSLHKNNCEKFNPEFERFVFDKFEHQKAMYGFLTYKKSNIYSSRYMLRAADVDSDGKIDLFAILKYDNTQRAVVLRNIASDKDDVGGRSFELDWRDDLNMSSSQVATYQPYAITAVDALGKGSVQFFLIGRNKNSGDFSLSIFEPKDMLDAFWLKVTILCYKCDNSSTTVIGANVFYYTTGLKGSEEVAYGSQSSQLAPFSLQAPYMLFGLGQQANYIEYIKVAYRNTVRPRPDSKKSVDMFKFDQLVPNAQVFAIPLESMWRLVMMVVPGKTLWQTLLVLGICCVVCLVIILVLHIKEKKEDEREKRKFNAKFNFDAM